MRAVIYSRVSTDAQERDGTSLDTQERASVELAEARGWVVVRSIRDAASGFTLDRDGVEVLRGMLKRGEADVVVAYAVDRLSRNQNHIGVLFDEIQQAGASLEFVTERFEDTAIGRFILAARAFIAEVEREKIAERTMRGKAERARSGRLPQGTGHGMYGYHYSPETGCREIAPVQASIVRRVFEEFASGASLNRIANDLNRDGVPAFSGGRWYPLTVRRMLSNETYTGRTIYRRTRAEKVRDVARNKWRRRVVERDAAEWIEVEGATPPIVSMALFERVGGRLNDPDRRARSQPSREYPLRGRLRCAVCGSAMVGQALLKGRYQYYRCRRSYAGPASDRCHSPYVPKGLLEQTVRESLSEVLASPDRILSEAERLVAAADSTSERASFDAEIAEVEARQRRLLRLFTAGGLPEELLREESRALGEQRARLEWQRAVSAAATTPTWNLDDLRARLPVYVAAIRRWLAGVGEDEFDLLLRAVDAQVKASRPEVEISGSVPLIESSDYADLVTIERTSA